jgi:hypothetical protein
MTWQNALKAAARGSGAPMKKRRMSGTSVGRLSVGKVRKRRRVSGTAVGSAGVGGRRRSVSRGFLGGTGGKLKQIAVMGAGMAGGIALTHFVLRPIENKLAQQAPWAGKFMAGAEVLLGGFMALKARSPFIKSIGVGIMAGGTFGVLKQFNVHVESPSVSGVGEYTHMEIPLTNRVAGMIGNMEKRHLHHHSHSNSSYMAGGDGVSATNPSGTKVDYYKSYLFA